MVQNPRVEKAWKIVVISIAVAMILFSHDSFLSWHAHHLRRSESEGDDANGRRVDREYKHLG